MLCQQKFLGLANYSNPTRKPLPYRFAGDVMACHRLIPEIDVTHGTWKPLWDVFGHFFQLSNFMMYPPVD